MKLPIRLKSEFDRKEFTYRLIERTDEKCLYVQLLNEIPTSYEVFLVKTGKRHWMERTELNKDDKIELFPRDEEFGKRAWTYPTLEKAKRAYEGLKPKVKRLAK